LAQELFDGANTLWAQCGVTFGSSKTATIRIIDPPPPHMLAVGCGLGLPSSGGTIRLRADGKPTELEVPAGWSPEQVARMLAQRLEANGLRVERSRTPRTAPGAYPVIDLLVYRDERTPAVLSAEGDDRVSGDPTMPVCINRVDLAQGLNHFLNVDSMAGTVEERALLKWATRNDRRHEPGTIEALFIPSFRSDGRIGESFIESGPGALPTAVIVDRAGVAASNASHTLAHELGHVLLEVGGHPDDFGPDEPTLLMDSDAALASAFGPRRLLVSECERAFRQSVLGPSPRLRPWPLEPLPKDLGRQVISL